MGVCAKVWRELEAHLHKYRFAESGGGVLKSLSDQIMITVLGIMSAGTNTHFPFAVLGLDPVSLQRTNIDIDTVAAIWHC